MADQDSLHHLAEERSLAFHRAVASRIPEDPDIVPHAITRVRTWLQEGGRSSSYARRWLDLLESPLPELLAAMVDESEAGRALRQATPFAGVLDARERWRLWRETKRLVQDSK